MKRIDEDKFVEKPTSSLAAMVVIELFALTTIGGLLGVVIGFWWLGY